MQPSDDVTERPATLKDFLFQFLVQVYYLRSANEQETETIKKLHNGNLTDFFEVSINFFSSFSYAGHGAGARFVDSILKMDCRAVALLFGCSSAALAVQGNLEGTGAILKFIMAGW